MKQYLPMVLLIAQTQTQTTTSRATAALHSFADISPCLEEDLRDSSMTLLASPYQSRVTIVGSLIDISPCLEEGFHNKWTSIYTGHRKYWMILSCISPDGVRLDPALTHKIASNIR